MPEQAAQRIVRLGLKAIASFNQMNTNMRQNNIHSTVLVLHFEEVKLLKRYLHTQQTHLQHPTPMFRLFSTLRQYGTCGSNGGFIYTAQEDA